LLARRADRIQALADELGDRAMAVQADVTDRGSLVAAADRVENELGGANVLVNNAGIMLLAPFSADHHDDHRRMVETNLLGAMTATEVFLEQLRASQGDLVNLSSVAGRTARPGNAVYAATKWGINGWSEALRQELHPDVRVIVIEPGAVATELTDHITDPGAKQAAEQMLGTAQRHEGQVTADEAFFDRPELGLVGLHVDVHILKLADLVTVAVDEHLPVPLGGAPLGLIIIFGHANLLVSSSA
jgi:NADP-dependent 3-hydroxy acid dehydrogenase YdfG